MLLDVVPLALFVLGLASDLHAAEKCIKAWERGNGDDECASERDADSTEQLLGWGSCLIAVCALVYILGAFGVLLQGTVAERAVKRIESLAAAAHRRVSLHPTNDRQPSRARSLQKIRIINEAGAAGEMPVRLGHGLAQHGLARHGSGLS